MASADGGKSRGRGISGIGYPAYRRRNDAFGKSAGRSVNLENDVIGKYVERLLGLGKSEEEKKESGITMEFLQEFGF